NDPETAVLSLHALTDLFFNLLNQPLKSEYIDDNGGLRIHTTNWSFENLFKECFYPVFDYGKKDRYIQKTLIDMTGQLLQSNANEAVTALLKQFRRMVEKEIDTSLT
ncbi:MAG: DUF2254 family protein, partial [Chitinophagaceae bacterium]